MGSERLYYDDAYTTRFNAEVAERTEREGRAAVELAATYFYPESGGQEADRGILGPARVLDVQADERGRIWHTVDAALE
ncbi:MAG: alanyl-tRNA editing protein, partial [Candidatus Eisenbacteria bacterium]